MDQISLVDRRIVDGQKVILQLVHDSFDVTAAFWLRPPEDPWWQYFIASKLVDQVGPLGAYETLQKSVQQLPGICISLTDIKLIGASNPVASDVRKLQKLAKDDQPLHIRSGRVGNLAADEIYIYPLPARHKRFPHPLGKRRLKKPVEQIANTERLLAPLSPQESRAREQIVASGLSPTQADYWVRKKREEEMERPAIPAGTVVNARVAAWWGDKPEDDPNPLLLVEAQDGARGITFLNNTEPA